MKYIVDIGSDQEHEDLVAEVCIDSKYLFSISQENGFENLEIEMYTEREGLVSVPLNQVLEAIEHAKRKLYHLRKTQ